MVEVLVGGMKRGWPGRGSGQVGRGSRSGRHTDGGGGDEVDDEGDNDLPEYEGRQRFRLERFAQQPIYAENPKILQAKRYTI